MEDFKILAFLCMKWGYGAADMAGTIRAQYPTTIRPIRVNCTARVTPSLIMRSIGSGADGVLIVGWYPGECDYEIGNKVALKNVEYVQEILEVIGFNPERVFMEYCSSAEGDKFQKTAIITSEKINKLGKSPLNKLKTE